MNCDDLASTGADIVAPLAVAAAILLLGIWLVVLARQRRKLRNVLLVALLLPVIVVGITVVGPPAARAANIECVVGPGTTNSLTITQTSTLSGLAPNRAPSPIAGLVINNSNDDTYITQVVVSIIDVTKAPGASAGNCDATDYVLVSPRMLVGEPLAAGSSAPFSGASIGFRNSTKNQNACKGATVTLLYNAE